MTATHPQIYGLLGNVMREIEAIAKDRRNDQQNYRFRGIDDVYNELHPLLAKHGVVGVPKVLEMTRSTHQSAKGGTLFYTVMKVEYTFFAPDGSSVVAIAAGEGMDSGDKATNKAMSGAHKYALMQLFAIPTEDEKDSELDSHRTASSNQDRKPAPKFPPSSAVKPPAAALPSRVAAPAAPAAPQMCGQLELADLKATVERCGWDMPSVNQAMWILCGQERLGAVTVTQFQTLKRYIEQFSGMASEGLRELRGNALSEESAPAEAPKSIARVIRPAAKGPFPVYKGQPDVGALSDDDVPDWVKEGN